MHLGQSKKTERTKRRKKRVYSNFEKHVMYSPLRFTVLSDVKQWSLRGFNERKNIWDLQYFTPVKGRAAGRA